jgi:hypothetical protein
MNSISDALSPERHQDDLQNTRFSGHSRQTSVNARERLDTGLTIQTLEGDIVTLSSNRFSEFNSFEYNSKGEIKTDSGNARISQHIQEITLTTGEQFSFSVEGDLNEQELADIAAIVKGVDGIASEVAEGDMDEAVEKAMSMGSYSSVSMYSADISYQRSYAVTDETRSVAGGPLSAPGKGKKHSSGPKHMDRFVDNMARFLEKQEDNLLAKAQEPLSELFDQLMKNAMETDKAKTDKGKTDKGEKETPAYEILKTAGKQVDKMINDLLKNAFGKTLNDFV